MKLVRLTNRQIIEISGEDRLDFLQDLITVNINDLAPDQPLWCGLLSPQGKCLFDFIIYMGNDVTLIDIDKRQANAFIDQLKKYILRADITITRKDDMTVLAFWYEDDAENSPQIKPVWFEKHQIVPDPRKAAMGLRWVGTLDKAENFWHQYSAYHASLEDYKKRRIENNIVCPAEDMNGIDFFWLEINAEECNGIDFKKGCFVGQEVTARMKHKTELKKKVISVNVLGEPQVPSTLQTDIQDIGTLIAYSDGAGLAYVRLDRWKHASDTLRSVTAGSAMVYGAAA
ncbi:MAG: hypothetical protein AAF621_02575 [Pseudomonadota bacterium]